MKQSILAKPVPQNFGFLTHKPDVKINTNIDRSANFVILDT